ncbi:hypothetical protein [Propylenella binzhouense]|uniref:Uncharacterized protein n=1 Tax=Propylenella binzhouense TaxID=2555902 RepID=A0A964T5B9_9HYPH|nr:hypothetical protein [Propylenella binzhouense]MYZ48803.1 hypothetical protein [Propylenella binzhouense]
MANASHRGMGTKKGTEFVGDTSPEALDQDDLASDIHGRNSLQGNDQSRVHNEREAVADSKRETEGLIESFERADPKKRAPR